MDEKIFFALERIHTATRSALQQVAQGHKLSPLQAQIIHYIGARGSANISDLANYMRVSKPTVSDSVAALITKGLVLKEISQKDGRGFDIFLTEAGIEENAALDEYLSPFLASIKTLSTEQKIELWGALLALVSVMEKQGLISHTRMCFSCQQFEEHSECGGAYCKLMGVALSQQDLRLDCPEHRSVLKH